MIGQIVLAGVILMALWLFGKKAWLSKVVKHYDPEELSQRMKSNDDFVLLDVRSASERQGKLIKGSVHIPLHELRRRLPELRKYQAKEIVCYCRSGNRSLTAAGMLRKEQFTLANLRGGIVGWNLMHR